MATDNRKFKEMSTLVGAWRTSGMGKKAFCAAHEINIHTFTYWVEKVEKHVWEEERVSPTKTKGFIALSIPESSPIASLELRFPQGAVLLMRGTLSAESVALVKSLLY